MRPSLEYLAAPCYMRVCLNYTWPEKEARSTLRMEKTQERDLHLCGTQPSFLLSKGFEVQPLRGKIRNGVGYTSQRTAPVIHVHLPAKYHNLQCSIIPNRVLLAET